MATKAKKSLSGSIDDVLGDLLRYDDETPVKSARAPQLAGGSSGRARGTSSQASKRSFLDDDFFSKLPAEDIEAAEGSSASDGDPQALLQTLKDMDDMEADLLGISKPSSGPGKTTAKGPGKCDSLGGAVKTTGKLLAFEKGDSVPVVEKPPLSSAPASRQYKKFNFEDLDDPLAGLLSDEEQDAPKKPAPTGTKSSSEEKTEQSKEKETPLHAVAPVRKREMLTFEDDGDDLMDALGFGSGPKGDEKQGKKAGEEELRPARSKLDELLGRGSVAKILEQPGTEERREFKLDKKYQKQPEKEEDWDKEDFVFGAYQPTVASTSEGRPSRRPSVRFSAENSSEPKPEPRSKPPPAASQSPVRGSRAGGDWLGLKDEDFMDSEPPSPAKASPAVSYPSPATERCPSPTGQPPAAEEAVAKPDPPEEENWLSAALSRKKAQAQAKAQERSAKPSEAPGEGLDPCSPVSQPAASTGAPQQAAALQDKAVSADGSGQPGPWLSTMKQASARPSEAAKGDPSRDASSLDPTALFPGEQETQGPAPLAQVTTPRAHLQAAPQLQAESPALGSLHERRLGAPAAQLFEDASGCRAALLSTQARVAELESQVRTLELEGTQHRLLLESLQQRHQEDLDLLESAHRSRVKVVEETYGQREERLRREKDQLAAQLLSQSRDVEQARAELLAQHQQRLAALEQQNALELERLRELQRASIQEMRKDHDEQLQRLKRLKDQEIDAVTSATSHTRSLNGVIEQMEKFSSDLHDLSHKVEATHHTTSQELAMGARQRDKQLKVLQDRLSQQQRDMEEERSRLQEVIAKMEARLGEQTRLLEQERWRATAEQSKVESLQRSLEEQRRVTTQQLSMERAELERAKSALLEEQKSVMQKCSEERRKLAAEWAEFHTRQQLSKERMEWDMDRALQMDSQREGTIMSLAKEQAELKMRGRELKAKEEQLVRDRELLDKAWQELRLEKEKVNGAALRIRQQEEEIKSMTKLSSQKYEEGERALREACRMESEHQTKLQVMQQNLEQLKQQEQRLHQERLSMAHQRRQLEQLREELPSNPVMLLTADQDLSAPTKGFSSTLCFSPPVQALPWHSLGSSRETLAMAGPTELYAKLLLLKHRAQQDRDFLEDEQFFLETLKKASYNTSSLSD
ncbi:fas-binding factor 1 isoform X2 [Egretta garzetta]|uniref:fas-binding factor 1 isoform X2 n=1 Tax=Egretta garzetta TaxID=188379 RepID=UPI00163C870B|nr:fas-binding factor 1 isoform X2 [Egretta garzetta]